MKIDKNEFLTGETIPIKLTIENTGPMPMKKIELELVRELLFFGVNHGKKNRQKRLTINKQIRAIVIPGRSSNNIIDFEFILPQNQKVMHATFNGGAFVCRYFLSFSFIFASQCCFSVKQT